MNSLFIFLLVLKFVYTYDVECTTALGNTTNVLDELFSYCVSDLVCSNMYYQSDVQNMTTFKFLINNILQTTQNLEILLESDICNKSYSDVLESVWLLVLKARRNERVVCDINHHLVLDSDSIRAECICNPNKMCIEEANDINLIHSFFVLVIVLTVFLIIENIWRIHQSITLMKKYKPNANIADIIAKIL